MDYKKLNREEFNEEIDCEKEHEAKMLNEFYNQKDIHTTEKEENMVHWEPVAKSNKIFIRDKSFERN